MLDPWYNKKSYIVPLEPHKIYILMPHGLGFPLQSVLMFSFPVNGAICSSMEILRPTTNSLHIFLTHSYIGLSF